METERTINLPLTLTEIMKNLPDIQVRYQGAVHNARLVGRLLDYPQVYIGGTIRRSWEITWDGAARAINNNRPITVD